MVAREQFDEQYYANNGQLGDRPALRFYTRLVRRYVGAGPYLDYGCGTGFLVRRLSELGPTAGFEVSPYSVRQARATAPAATIYERPEAVPDAIFGGLTAIHVLEHLDDDVLAGVFATWRRVLRPGARALVVVPDPAGRARELTGQRWMGYSDPTHINLKPAAEWHRVLTGAGFDILREASDGLWNVPYGGRPKYLEALRYSVPALTQFLAGRLFLRRGRGESAIFVAQLR